MTGRVTIDETRPGRRTVTLTTDDPESIRLVMESCNAALFNYGHVEMDEFAARNVLRRMAGMQPLTPPNYSE